MISAKLIEDLKNKGFALTFPGYDSNEEEIIDILKENNERLNLAIPLLLTEDFDYKKIIKKLDSKRKNIFDQIIIITKKIFKLEKINSQHLEKIIKENNLTARIIKDKFDYYYDLFKSAIKEQAKKKEEQLQKQIKLRAGLNIKKALSRLYAPAKIRIMDKIFHHEKLTNTELKYYYKSIKPLISAILNDNMQEYLKIVEATKKYVEKYPSSHRNLYIPNT